MTETSLPWSDIQRPEYGYRRRLASNDTIVPVSWGKDAEARYVLIVELDGDYADQARRMDLSVRGMSVDLRLIESIQTIVVTLEERVNADLFHNFCRSLIGALEQATDPSHALSITGNHVARWRNFLSGRRRGKLSEEEVRGLFGELWLLNELLEKTPSHTEAVSAWCGPEKVHQDFILGSFAIECKVLSGKERNSVRISSEDQLEAVSGDLYLAVIGLRSAETGTPQAYSLNTLVKYVEGRIEDPDAVNEFGRKLSAVGYLELPDYDEPVFLVHSRQFYRVTDDFPRLIRSQIPAGITRVGYEIKMEAIETYKCNEQKVWA